MPRVFINGASLHYEEAGSGTPLLLLHAWPTDHAIWQLQIPVFSQQYRTIAVDLRGCGQSDKPTGRNSPETMCCDMIHLLDALNIHRAAICGISMGGVVAAQMTLDYPACVIASVWAGAASDCDSFFVKSGGETIPILDAYLRVLEPEGYQGFWEKVWKAQIGGLFNKEFVHSRVGSYLIRSLFEERYVRMNSDPTAIIQILAHQRGWNIRDRLREVATPVQILVGEQDATLPHCQEQGSLVTGSRLSVIADSGHFFKLGPSGNIQ